MRFPLCVAGLGPHGGQGVADGGHDPLVGGEQGQVAAHPEAALDEGPLGAEVTSGDRGGGGVVGGEPQVGRAGVGRDAGGQRHMAIDDVQPPHHRAVGPAGHHLLDRELEPGQRRPQVGVGREGPPGGGDPLGAEVAHGRKLPAPARPSPRPGSACQARRMTDTVPAGLTAADERHHPVGEGDWWNESWYFDFATADGALGGYVRLGLYPTQGACWYWACLVGEDRPLVIVVDHDVAPPRAGALEIRGEGLWADHQVEVPFDHMTLACEAFALGVDDPAAVYGPARGDRVPFGLDLEWDTDGSAYPYPPGTTRYEVPCRVHGEVLVGDERIELDAIGQRDHSWGQRDWWTLGWTWTAGALDDGTRFHGTVPRLADEPLPYH